ncbi:MAG: YifB family Mg chelatase-like AAA ATPase [Corynebacterium sp.]|uniref:YifB family Mg chelatase-like AAA ATPase n=1 Tax=Corynebacterium sp. TaxID=1720 RepID=UPI0026DFDFCB|nr:YifB family Mg chelatase-like AAA ATPase [Corynebacterium sp.]MDO5670714.1 YifB family Mg chelatase-like AAA ATPase [Corynebacterium sp.]
MALGRAHTIALDGVVARLVTVEANIGPGLPGIHLVGLGDAAVSESKDRVRTAVANARLPWPKTKIIVSMSPASLRKSGSHFDLSTALAVLAAGLPAPRLRHAVIVGELGLDGSVRPVPGVLPALLTARQNGFTHALIPPGNAGEAALIDGLTILAAPTLAAAWAWATGDGELPQARGGGGVDKREVPDFADLNGQQEARFAAEVAAAGGHHMLLLGPPGSGKSMIAARLPGILPPLTPAQSLEATAVHSVAGNGQVMRRAPYIDPHHSVTRAALLGGGSGQPRPGAVSLAHHGVLFIDEASEVPAAILDGLRMPLEDGQVRLMRSQREVVFPARFQLVLAANPCRCATEDPARCRCNSRERAGYLRNLSGPMRDRIDITARTTTIGRLDGDEEPSAVIAERVGEARMRARARFGCINAAMDPHRLRREHPADEVGMSMLGNMLGAGEISQRGVDRTLKMAWTLADLDGATQPNIDHIARAAQLRGEE